MAHGADYMTRSQVPTTVTSSRRNAGLINRHYVMTKILGRDCIRDYIKLTLFEVFSLASSLKEQVTSSIVVFVY